MAVVWSERMGLSIPWWGGRLPLHLARDNAELVMKALGKIRGAAESDSVGDLGNRARFAFQQLLRPVEAHEPYQLIRGQIGERGEFPVELAVTHRTIPCQVSTVYVSSPMDRSIDAMTLFRNFSSMGVIATSEGFRSVVRAKRSRMRLRPSTRL